MMLESASNVPGKIQWNDYEATPPAAEGPLHLMSRDDAEATFAELMAAKDARKAALLKLLSSNGVDFELAQESISRIGSWLISNVEPAPAGTPEYMRDRWYVVAQDVGLVLGDLLISRAPWLRWQLFTASEKDMAYQRPVVMGFRKTTNPLYNYDPILVTANLSIAAAEGHNVEANELASSFEYALDLA